MDAPGMYELLSRLSCPLCGGTRGTSVLAVLDNRSATDCLVRAQCVRCHLFWSFPLDWLANGGPEHAHEHGTVADPISADEVLDLHIFLRDFDGPLTSLLPS